MANLRDLLKNELITMQPPEITRFKRELALRLPETVKTCADLAKLPVENAAVKNNPGGMSENVRKNNP
jgi:hypothetical protein